MNEINLSLFGERLKKSRKDLGLSQSDAAELVGVTREHWGRCERGLGMPGGEVLAALANAGADVLYILTGMHAATHAAMGHVRTAADIAGKLGGTKQEQAERAEAAFHQLQQPLPADEQMWLDCYREWSPELKKRELRRAMGGQTAPVVAADNDAVQIHGTGSGSVKPAKSVTKATVTNSFLGFARAKSSKNKD